MRVSAVEAVLKQAQREAVLIIDLVDSVRLMQADEAGVIERWLAFQRLALEQLVPSHGGTVARSTGDGLVLRFGSPLAAVKAAQALHRLIGESNRRCPPRLAMALRAGIHMTQLYEGGNDIYGDGVNLAARLMSLGGPCETIVSEAARDGLTDELDGAIEDLGECYLKNVDRAVRAYRVGAAGPAPLLATRTDYLPTLEPTIAIIPFEARQRDDPHALALGELVADGVIACLSRDRHLRIISRLSSRAFQGVAASTDSLRAHLGVDYVLTGSYGSFGGRVLVHFELCDVSTGRVLASDRVSGAVADLLAVESEIVACIVQAANTAIFRDAMRRVQTQPLPTLQSYALLLGAVQLLHRSTTHGFEQSQRVLDYLVEKHPRAVEPRLWLAKWHALRAVQDSTVDRAASARAALSCTRRALDADPTNAFALAMEGFVHCHLTMNYDAATTCLGESIASNRSESLGHLFHGLMQGLKGSFEDGILSYREARSISPLDPEAYLIDSIGAYLHLGARRHDEAIELARRSLRSNRLHAHSWRALTVALAETGRVDEAQQSLQHVLTLQPGLTVAGYLSGARTDDDTRRRFAEGLHAAGLPAH